ncbi:unnamed protein product [Brugia timori]|uniref:Conjugal transfer protein TrbA n=1 Tax=Brugia timori TaxID=42155 RepID=A0A0R3QNK9_9BILA|nr:unnamed protein product [Brugia timori]
MLTSRLELAARSILVFISANIDSFRRYYYFAI